MKLQNLLRAFTIRTRMQGALVMVLAMFAIVGLTGLSGGLKLKALNDEILSQSSGEQRHVADMRSHLAAVRLFEKQMVIDYEDSAAVLKSREAWSKQIAATKTSLEAMLAGDEDEDNTVVRASLEQLAAYVKAAEPVLQQTQNGGYDSARIVDKMLARAKTSIATVEADVEKLDAIVTAETAASAARFESTMRTAMLMFFGALGLMVALVMPLTLLNSRSITQPIAYARTVAQAIAAGDLTKPIRLEGRDEASQLLAALLQMQEWLRQVVGDVRHSSGSIEHASHEVAAGNADLSVRTEQAASSLQQTAASMEQLTGTVGQSADAARQASQLATSAAAVAQRGGVVVSQVVTTMDEINSSSKRIADIIGTIDSIAFQTNILALNAAVEAARAGEQGRGFAVVASEVRSLAQRSADAAREIKGLIGASVDKVETGSKLVANAGSTMAEIVASVQRVSDIIGEVMAATGEQRSGIGQVNTAVGQLDQMTQQNAALVEQSSAAAESLKEQAGKLAELVSTFRVGAEAAPLAAQAIAAARVAAPTLPQSTAISESRSV